MGMATAPSHFKATMADLLSRHLLQTCVVHLNDVTVFASTPSECWERTLLVSYVLGDGSTCFAANKPVFCTTECKLLGHLVQCGDFTTNLKSLHKLAILFTPKSLKQL